MKLFEPYNLGGVELKNRLVMAPMTRGRAQADGTPSDLQVEYYRQRATAGLIITEATSISSQGHGWVGAPGIFTESHRDGWKAVTHAVHAAGGRILLQLWHMGRVSHPDFLNGELPVGPSAIAAQGESYTATGKKPYVVPRALDAAELPGIVADYARAAKLAIDAGFDGVEIHAANGYLLDQFLRDGSNHRTDSYGGSIENRVRLLREVMEAVTAAAGAERTGVRISPNNPYNDMRDSNPLATFSAVAQAAREAKLLFLHVMDPVKKDHMLSDGSEQIHPALKPIFGGPLMVNGGYDRETAEAAIHAGTADLVAFGVPFLANPDLVRRYAEGASLNRPSFPTFYFGGEKGYTDYPALA
ncbi:MAG: alkene reductase [Bryobacteraceae bacterium]|nr:alkene reductase [Bryobacteraceae bacterium]